MIVSELPSLFEMNLSRSISIVVVICDERAARLPGRLDSVLRDPCSLAGGDRHHYDISRAIRGPATQLETRATRRPGTTPVTLRTWYRHRTPSHRTVGQVNDVRAPLGLRVAHTDSTECNRSSVGDIAGLESRSNKPGRIRARRVYWPALCVGKAVKGRQRAAVAH